MEKPDKELFDKVVKISQLEGLFSMHLQFMEG